MMDPPQMQRGPAPPPGATDGRRAAVPPLPGALARLAGIDAAEGLRFFAGKVDSYLRALQGFREETGADFAARYTRAIQKGDGKEARRLAHSLKGSARLLGASYLGVLAEALESSALQGGGLGANGPLAALSREFEIVMASLAALAEAPAAGTTGEVRSPATAPAAAPDTAPAAADPAESILLIDDDLRSIEAMRSTLQERYRVLVAVGGIEGIGLATEHRPGLILLDLVMPGMDGYLVCHALKADPRTRDIPIIFLTASQDPFEEQAALEIGAVDFIRKPSSPFLVRRRVRTHLDLHNQSVALEARVRERTRVLEQTQVEIIRRLGRASEFRDNETGAHVMRMSQICRLLAVAAGVPERQADVLLLAAPMHDVGKIGIPDAILRKPGRLDAEERRIMERHTVIGAEIIGPSDAEPLVMAREIALTHHERWDGQGYPRGLAGNAIPLVGRIAAIADVFDALTSHRPYKAPWPCTEAFDYIRDHAGTAFDPGLVPRFLELREQVLAIESAYPDSAAIAPAEASAEAAPARDRKRD
jgi:putative two-component system response regulator